MTSLTTQGGRGGLDWLPHQEIWCCDFEFHGADGDVPVPVCMVAREARTGQTYRIWQDGLAETTAPPFDTGPDALFVAYYASAEIGCFLALGWEPPARILDLFTEFRAETNGLSPPHGNGLLGALGYFGLPMIGGDEKTSMRDLVLTGGPRADDEQAAILDYCQGDVDALLRFLPAMAGWLWPRNPTTALSDSGRRSCEVATWPPSPAWSILAPPSTSDHFVGCRLAGMAPSWLSSAR